MSKKHVKFPTNYLLIALVIVLGALFFGYKTFRKLQIFQLTSSTSSSSAQYVNRGYSVGQPGGVTWAINENTIYPPILLKDPFTIEFFAKPEILEGNRPGLGYVKQYLLFNQYDSSNNFEISRLTLNEYKSEGKIRPEFKLAYIAPDGTTKYMLLVNNTDTPISDQVWNHYAYIASKNGNTCEAKLYVGGALHGSTSSLCQNFYTTAKPGRYYQHFFWSPAIQANIDTYIGAIDEYRLSNSVRYNADFIPPTSPFNLDVNTVSLYSFEDSANNQFIDSTANEQNLVITNYHSTNIETIQSNFIVSTPTPSPSSVPSIGPSPTPTPSLAPSPSVKPTCKPRPACLSARPPCNMPITENVCSPSPKPSKNPRPTPTPKPSPRCFIFLSRKICFYK